MRVNLFSVIHNLSSASQLIIQSNIEPNVANKCFLSKNILRIFLDIIFAWINIKICISIHAYYTFLPYYIYILSL